MEKPRAKCDETGWCRAMDERLQPNGPKGIVLLEFMDFQTMKPTGSLVAYKQTSRDRGLVLNFCPWCGSEYRAWNPILTRKENRHE